MKNIYLSLLVTTISTGLFASSNVLKLKITAPNSYSDETIVRFTQGATEGFDGQFDAWKIFSNYQQVPSLWTQIPTGEPLSINAQPELNKDYTIDLYTWINNAGNHSIKIEEMASFNSNATLYLYDKTTTQLWEISDGDSISLYFNQSIDSTARLQLIFSLPMQTNQISEGCNGTGSLITINDSGSTFDYEIQDSQSNIVATATGVGHTDTLYDLLNGNYSLYITYPYNLTEIHSFSVTGKSVTASIHVNNTTVKLSEGAEVTFSNNSSGALDYSWDLGDGKTSNEVDPTHSYTLAGTYIVTLTATNNNCSAQDQIEIQVLDDTQTSIGQLNNNTQLMLKRDNAGYYIHNQARKKTNIAVYSLDGKQVLAKATSVLKEYLPLDDGGIYVVSAKNENEAIQSKVYK